MSDRPLTILQLTHQGGGSGSTTIIADLSRQLARRGHRVLVGCRPDTKLAHLARDAGLELVPLDFRRLGPLARALEEVTDREGVDVANSNATRDRRALTWLRWTRRLGLPFVVTRHTMPLTSPAELVAVGLSADRTIAVSHAVARALRRRLHPAARLRVAYVPFTDRPLAFCHLARVSALPSRIEGLSIALLETMALGLPVVASDAGGNPDLITPDDTGLLVPPLDPGAWARSLARVLDDAEFAARIARHGRELVRREFTLERSAERTEAVYREAAERRRSLDGDRTRAR